MIWYDFGPIRTSGSIVSTLTLHSLTGTLKGPGPFGERNMWAAPYLDKTATLANICCWPSPISSFSSEIGFLNGPPSNLLPSGICYPGAFAQKAITKTKEELNEDAQKECAK